MIETLEDIVEEVADNIGVYGSHTEVAPDGQCECRVCFTTSLKLRIRDAMEIDLKLSGASYGELQARVDTLAMFVRRMLNVMALNKLQDRRVFEQATQYLRAARLAGSILRDEDIQEQKDKSNGGDRG